MKLKPNDNTTNGKDLPNSILWNKNHKKVLTIEKPDVLFEFLDENGVQVIFGKINSLAESAYIYKIFERENENDIQLHGGQQGWSGLTWKITDLYHGTPPHIV